jgi:hypothetical protein
VEVRGKVAIGITHQEITIAGGQLVTDPRGVTRSFQGGLLALSSNIGRFDRDEFAVVPECGINLGYQFTDHFRAYVGYNLLYWSNVLRPGDQIDRALDVTLIPNFPVQANAADVTRPAVPFQDTDFWVQGLNFGFEFRF